MIMKTRSYLSVKILFLLLSLMCLNNGHASETLLYFSNQSQCSNTSLNIDVPFTISSDRPWCYVTAFSAEKYFQISVSANGAGIAAPDRFANIILSIEGQPDIKYSVAQAGVAPIINVRETNIAIAPGMQEFTLDISSNTDITFILPSWISEKSGNEWKNGTKTYSFIVSGTAANQGNIVVKAKDPAFNKQVTIPVVKQESLRIIAMQYNIRVQTTDDGNNNWPNRKATAAQFIRAMNTDVVGTQEMSKTLLGVDQYNDLKGLLSSDYDSYVGYRDESSFSDEGNAIFYKKNRFTLVNSGKFWLSETPDTKSKGWDAGYNRIAVWVVLREKTSNREVFVINTHFDNTGSTARNQSATLMVQKINTLSGGRPVILTGDLNTIPASTPVNTLKTILDHTKDVAITTSGPSYTIHDYNENPSTSVFFDYVFTSKEIGRINSHVVAAPKYNGVFLSDHCPVTVNMDIYFNP